MFYSIFSYFKFLFRSRNQHGVHSPFVYGLVTKCFYDTKEYPAYRVLDSYRRNLLKDNGTISVTEMGSGSRVFKNDQRSISQIAKHAGISKKRQKLLFRLTEYLNIKSSLELGTSLGLATVALCQKEDNKVTTIEGCPNTAAFAKKHLTEFSKNQPEIIIGTFEEEIHKLGTKKYDLIYIDGNHNKKSTLDYFEKLLLHAPSKTVIIFDDIYWSAEMTSAWREIIGHPKVTVSIDTFYWGIVFLRKEQRKESFTIRL